MSLTLQSLQSEALTLPEIERGQLIESLISSLEVDPGIEQAWADEVARRIADVKSGAAKMIPGDEALARLRAEFK